MTNPLNSRATQPVAAPASYERERRCELLAAATREEMAPLAERVLAEVGAERLSVIHPPEVGMTMLAVREPVAQERFYLGEVLVTRCTVDLDGFIGWSMRGGEDRVAALAGALLDAAAAADPAASAEIDEVCRQVEARMSAAQRAEWDQISGTQVAFEELV